MNPYKVNRRNKRRVVVLFESDELSSIDRHGVENAMPSRSEAIRQIVRTALNEKGPAGSAIPPSQEHDPIPTKEEANEQLAE